MNPFNRVLILENSSRVGQVGLAEDGTVIASRQLAGAARHATDLPVVIQSVLNEQKWKCDELSAIVVCLGPGSYTGLRVGVMAAKTLAYALKAPLFGVPGFAAIAGQTPSGAGIVDVIADALQRTLFAQRFRRTSSAGWEPVNPIQACALLEWKTQCLPGQAISGPGVSAYPDDMPEGCHLATLEAQQPQLGSLLQEAMSGKHPLVDPWLIEPIYVRGSSAEEKRRGAKG
jgi:tRNA threonylcarbamoyladenosine biosynthesis protein TsaB